MHVGTEFTVLTTPLHWIQCTWKHRLVAVHAQHAPISIGGLREKLNTENTVYCSGHACEPKGYSSMLAIDVGWLQLSTTPQPLYWQRASVKHGPIRRPPRPRPPLKVMVKIDQRVRCQCDVMTSCVLAATALRLRPTVAPEHHGEKGSSASSSLSCLAALPLARHSRCCFPLYPPAFDSR